MASYENDYKKGKECESKYIDAIKEYFDDNIISCVERYSIYDFKGEKSTYELKSRNNEYTKYPTTIISCRKVIKNLDIDQHFLFAFTDGLYYIKYDDELFKTFDVEPYVRRKREGRIDKPELYYFIPIEYLNQIF